MIIKWVISCCMLISVCLLCDKTVKGQNGSGKIKTVCLDAGHGGVDPGAVGKNGTQEKVVTLNVALRVGELLKQRYPDIKVVYTRTKDVSVPLINRGKIANKAGADVFISIHTNAFDRRDVKGIETYVLGSNSNEHSLRVAMKENAAIRYEEDYTTKYVGFDPNRPESYIIFNLIQNIHLEKSLELAGHMQKEMVKSSRLPDREVRQAGYLVLKDAAMPSVLVEMGYISNLEEERYLKSKVGQDNMANAIVKAFARYKDTVEKNIDLQLVVQDQNKNDEPIGNAKKEVVKEQKAVTETVTKVTKVTPRGVEGLVYAIQVCSSTAKMKSFGHLKVATKVNELHSDGRYRYYVYPSSNYDDVVKNMSTVRRSVKDCFPIAIYKGKQISVTKAKEMSK
ncbi:MAG: N-acetylmuramoyl-L-alanine amidase family protein [Marinifilaceae bacterium]